ncbi:MAG: HAMP domain-containing sensor histidine kinase [Pseudomonadota bacterium]
MWLTVLFVMIAEVLIFVPSVANFRITWLDQRLDTVAATSVLITQADDRLPRAVQDDVLMATGAKAIALRRNGMSELLVVSEMPPATDYMVDVDNFNAISAIAGAFETMVFGGDRNIRVVGDIGESQDRIEMVYHEEPLRSALFIYARNVALISLAISLITAALVFVAINRIMIRPVRNVTGSMLAFAAQPETRDTIIMPTGRNDELGIIETELADMQEQLHSTLKGQKHLADLGLAVSKINHDMRNVLASAQLLSDRLSTINEPSVQRFAPKLVRSIDRAVAYTSEVLEYGAAAEQKVNRRRCRFSGIVDDVEELLGLGTEGDVEFARMFDPQMEVDCDPEHLFRVLMNLSRNAVQAMREDNAPDAIKRLTLSATRLGSTTIISVEDTGPGLPEKARENLFAAFKGSARSGGTGLGLAIAYELVQAQGGTIELRDRGVGTHFEIRLPDAPVSLASHRAAKSA